jgi:hypothetical protein
LTVIGALLLRSREVGKILSSLDAIPAPGMAPSKASSRCDACRTGENDILPSGVVGAVEVSITLYSEPAIVEGASNMAVNGEAMTFEINFALGVPVTGGFWMCVADANRSFSPT